MIGFNNGCFHRLYKKESDRFSKKYIDLFKVNTDALELHYIGESIKHLPRTTKDHYQEFEYLSLHAPAHIYQNNKEAVEILKEIRKLVKRLSIKNIVLHPDLVQDWSLFKKFSDLPFSIENMDQTKTFGSTVSDIDSVIRKNPFLKLTLDLQHCFMVDNSMKIAKDFHDKFGDKIVEYHISGYEERYIHYPLFKTKQDIIIDSLEFKEIPIIIESTFDEIGEEQQELEYISRKL